MAEQLKYMYHPGFFEKLCPVLDECLPGFHTREFIFSVFDNKWPDLGLNGRIRKISTALHRFMPDDFADAAGLLTKISCRLLTLNEESTFAYMFLPDYVEVYGINHPVESLNCLEQLTKLVSAENAVRRFVERYPDQALHKMMEWSFHSDERVRRLANQQSGSLLPSAVAVE